MTIHLFKRHLFTIASLIIIIGAVVVFSTTNLYGMKSAHADSQGNGNVVGAWFVNAVGAPFQPHVATFHSDQTMEIDNPEAGDTHTSDSMGMGPWSVNPNNNNVISGKFVEVNADRTTNQYVSKLIVTYTITVTGNTFTGPAQATYYNPDGTLQAGPFPATLNGTKITLP